MGNDDVLILTIYALVVFYVLYQMALSYEALQKDQIQLLLDTDATEEATQAQLEQQQPQAKLIKAKVEERNLTELLKILAEALGREAPKGKKTPSYFELVFYFSTDSVQTDLPLSDIIPKGTIGIAVFPQRKAALEAPIQFLNVEIDNRTADYQVYIDWDRSSITYISKRAQRAIRVLPDERLDPYQPQIYSVVNPGQQLRANVTIESSFGRNEETQQIELQRPLIDIAGLAEEIGREKSEEEKLLRTALGGGASKSQDLEKDKKESNKPIQESAYTLTLWVSMKPFTAHESQAIYLLLPFKFDALLLPGEIAFPPLRWLLSRPRHRVENIVTTVITGRPSRHRR